MTLETRDVRVPVISRRNPFRSARWSQLSLLAQAMPWRRGALRVATAMRKHVGGRKVFVGCLFDTIVKVLEEYLS